MNGRANLLVTNAPPFDNPVLRRAMQLSLDRKSFIDILGEGQYDIGTVQPPPEGIWGISHHSGPRDEKGGPGARPGGQSAARDYSMTSSTRERIKGGIVRPSAAAVFKLTTTSNLVGCWTGRSAGLAPFRILST